MLTSAFLLLLLFYCGIAGEYSEKIYIKVFGDDAHQVRNLFSDDSGKNISHIFELFKTLNSYKD